MVDNAAGYLHFQQNLRFLKHGGPFFSWFPGSRDDVTNQRRRNKVKTEATFLTNE